MRLYRYNNSTKVIEEQNENEEHGGVGVSAFKNIPSMGNYTIKKI